MKAEQINSFAEASQDIINQVTGCQINIGESYVKQAPYRGDSAVVLIGITGQLYGSVILSFSTNLACKIASIMMGGMSVPELDEIAKSAVAELSNMILGNAAANLYKIGITVDITPPTVFTGSNMSVSPTQGETISFPLKFDDGEVLEFDLIIKEK